MHFKGFWLVGFLTYVTVLAEDPSCGNKGKPCDPDWFCDGTRCQQCKYVTTYCFMNSMPTQCLGFCKTHQENEIRKDEEIKCGLKLKNLTETFEVANNLTAYIPDVLNKTENQPMRNLEEHSSIWFIISIFLAMVCVLTWSFLIPYIIHLRRLITHFNKNSTPNTEGTNIRFLNNNEEILDNDIDQGAAESDIAGEENTQIGIQDNQPHCPENGILSDALQNKVYKMKS